MIILLEYFHLITIWIFRFLEICLLEFLLAKLLQCGTIDLQ